MPEIFVREAQFRDLHNIAALDANAYGAHGTPTLSFEELEEWYEFRSPYFLVAEHEGKIVGYYYGLQVDFSIDDVDSFVFKNGDEPVYRRHKHNPDAASVYGISVASVVNGAGHALNSEVHRLLEVMNIRYFLGFTRLMHLDRYIISEEKKRGEKLPYAERDIALWYAHESARLLNMREWVECTPKPDLALPPLRRPDPIMRYHAQDEVRIGLLRILPDYMEDPGSRNYGAFVASERPHHTT